MSEKLLYAILYSDLYAEDLENHVFYFCNLTSFELKSVPISFLQITQKFELTEGFVFTVYSLEHFLRGTNQ